MKRFLRMDGLSGLMVLVLLLTALMLFACGGQARAAGSDTTDNPSLSSSAYQVIVLPLMGTYTGASTKTGLATIRSHWPMRVLACHSAIQATTATAGFHARMVVAGGPRFRGSTTVFTNLSSTRLASDAVNVNVADETNVRFDLTGPGVGKSVSNITLDIAVKRR